jgi:hypothetical protein
MFSWSPQEVARAQGAYGGWLDAVKDVIGSVVPSKTIVGKWAAGDNAGAAQAAGNFIAQTVKPAAPKPPAMNVSAQYRSGMISVPGIGNVSQTTLLLLAAGLAGALFFLRRRRGR